MTEKLGKWFPLSINNTPHVCFRSKKKKEPKNQLKNPLKASLLLENLDARVKKLERIVVDPRL